MRIELLSATEEGTKATIDHFVVGGFKRPLLWERCKAGDLGRTQLRQCIEKTKIKEIGQRNTPCKREVIAFNIHERLTNLLLCRVQFLSL